MSYYKELNIKDFSDISTVKEAYYNILKRSKKDKELRSKLPEINKIYSILSDPVKKLKYDNEIREDINRPSITDELRDIYESGLGEMNDIEIKTKTIEELMNEREEDNKIFKENNKNNTEQFDIASMEDTFNNSSMCMKYDDAFKIEDETEEQKKVDKEFNEFQNTKKKEYTTMEDFEEYMRNRDLELNILMKYN